MKIFLKIIRIFFYLNLCCLTMLASRYGFSHEVTMHQAITQAAYQSSSGLKGAPIRPALNK
jgi:hypothetical protein